MKKWKKWDYEGKGTIKRNLEEIALDAIAEVIWGDVRDDSAKLNTINGIMLLLASVDEDMTEAKTEVQYDAQAGD